MDVLFFSKEMKWFVKSCSLILSASCQEIKVPEEHFVLQHALTLPYLCASFSSRKKDANINFIQNFNRTSQNSIILNRSKSRRRLIRSNGADDRMQLISSFPQTVLLYHLRVCGEADPS